MATSDRKKIIQRLISNGVHGDGAPILNYSGLAERTLSRKKQFTR